MRFLMVCMQYPTEPGRSYMTAELADALVAAGHTVEVLHLDWTAPAGARSDVLRGKNCNKYTFHVDVPNTVMVNAVGKALLRDNMVKGKKFFSLTADYVFGHDLLRAAKAFFGANQGNLIGDELVATDVTDFSPYLLKVRQAALSSVEPGGKAVVDGAEVIQVVLLKSHEAMKLYSVWFTHML